LYAIVHLNDLRKKEIRTTMENWKEGGKEKEGRMEGGRKTHAWRHTFTSAAALSRHRTAAKRKWYNLARREVN
jgi:hypothetical protein